MLRIGAASILMIGMLSACGHSPQERAASGALIGGAVGAVVGLANNPGYDDHHYEERRPHKRPHHKRPHHKKKHHRPHHHDDDGWRRGRGHDDWQYYD